MAIINGVGDYVPAELRAARGGRGLCLKVNSKAGINAAATVLTDAGMLYAIPANTAIVITCFYMHLDTASDWATMELVVTANANGSGTVTALSPMFRIDTGNAADGQSPALIEIHPPLYLTQSHGLAFSVRAQTNDAAAALTVGCNGWTERVG